MAKIINILGNEKIKVKNSQIRFNYYGNKVFRGGVIFLENNSRIIINHDEFTLQFRSGAKGRISKHSPAYRQIIRAFRILSKKYRLHGIFNNGFFRLEKTPNLEKIRNQVNPRLKKAV